MKEKEFREEEKLIFYIEFLNNNMLETGNDDWELPFMDAMLKFKKTMYLKYPELHKLANKYANEKSSKLD